LANDVNRDSIDNNLGIGCISGGSSHIFVIINSIRILGTINPVSMLISNGFLVWFLDSDSDGFGLRFLSGKRSGYAVAVVGGLLFVFHLILIARIAIVVFLVVQSVIVLFFLVHRIESVIGEQLVDIFLLQAHLLSFVLPIFVEVLVLDGDREFDSEEEEEVEGEEEGGCDGCGLGRGVGFGRALDKVVDGEDKHAYGLATLVDSESVELVV